LRQTEQAVELAAKAVEKAPQAGHCWNTLGVARYRHGQFQEAIAALQKSMDLRSGGDPNDWLFLAMAHWRLGNKEQARRWYGKGVEWLEQNIESQDEELLGFRHEAEELMGIAATKPQPQAPSPGAATKGGAPTNK
jgi:uncharacterized protein HemY